MAVSIYIDGDLRRIYEVPDDSMYTTDGNGYRKYVANDLQAADKTPMLDVQRDVWSRYVDWYNAHLWSTRAMTRSGGAQRGVDDIGNPVYATNDYQMRVSIGWQFVPADYPHVLTLVGNYLSDTADPLFDSARIASPGVIAYIRMADSLQTYQVGSSAPCGSGAVFVDGTIDVDIIEEVISIDMIEEVIVVDILEYPAESITVDVVEDVMETNIIEDEILINLNLCEERQC
jgi:hypothetical protein